MPAPSLRAIRAKLDAKKDAGLAVVGLLVFAAGFGSWAAIVVTGALALLWWGRALGLAALFAFAISAAAHVSACRAAEATSSSPPKPTSLVVRDLATTRTG